MCRNHPCRIRYFCLDNDCSVEIRGICGECNIEGPHKGHPIEINSKFEEILKEKYKIY